MVVLSFIGTSPQLLIFICQEKELAKEMGGLSVEASTSTASSGGAGGATDGVKKYNKSSFFDEISCDVLDRAAGTGGRELTTNALLFHRTRVKLARFHDGGQSSCTPCVLRTSRVCCLAAIADVYRDDGSECIFSVYGTFTSFVFVRRLIRAPAACNARGRDGHEHGHVWHNRLTTRPTPRRTRSQPEQTWRRWGRRWRPRHPRRSRSRGHRGRDRGRYR